MKTRHRGRTSLGVLATILAVAVSCEDNPARKSPEIDLDPFKEVARNSECSDVRNRLFLIDRTLVLWDSRGSCADATYLVRLHSGTIQQVLCEYRDSIAGPVRSCPDPRFREMFDTIFDHLEAPNLGLGPEHHVQEIAL